MNPITIMKKNSLLRLTILAALLPFAAVLSVHAADPASAPKCTCGVTCKAPCNPTDQAGKTGACASSCGSKADGAAACEDCKCGPACKAEAAPKADAPAKCEADCAKK
jgi:hypothetical protein